MDEWSCSEWITSDSIFIRSGEYWYPVLNIGQIAEALQKVVEAVAEAFKEIVEYLSKNLIDRLPNISIALDEDEPEQYMTEPRRRWKPVRYIRANDRLTDRRPPMPHIRNALPNMNRDRREKREGD